MKKSFKSLMALAMCFSVAYVNAQDVITKKNGDEIQAKITEVGQNEIKYKRFDNLDGPVYTIGKSDVFMVKYQNGTKDVFKEEPSAQSSVSNSYDSDDFWKPYYWTNKRVAGISPYVDLGGLGFTGPRIGLEARYRRFWVNAFYKYGNIGAMNTVYLNDDEMYNPPQNIVGNGGGFTVKFLFPFSNSNGAMFIGVMNEWSNYSCTFIDGDKRIDWTNLSVGNTGFGAGFTNHASSGFYFTVGGYFGASANNLEFIRSSSPNSLRYDNWIVPFVTCEIAIGFEIGMGNK